MDKLPPEYNGLSGDLENKVSEPAPLVPDGEQPEPPQQFKEKVIVPEDANVQPKGGWKLLLGILACAALLVACVVLLLLGYETPAGICAGVFAVAVTVFLVSLTVAEKRLLSGKGVLNKPDNRKITARVIECACVSRSYKEHRDIYGRFYARELVGAVYVIRLKESGENAENPEKIYVAKSKQYFAQNEEVAAYVRGKYAYIDLNAPFNAQKTATRKNHD